MLALTNDPYYYFDYLSKLLNRIKVGGALHYSRRTIGASSADLHQGFMEEWQIKDKCPNDTLKSILVWKIPKINSIKI